MTLPRCHLFEFNDSSFAPRALRDLIVEALSRTLDWGNMVAALVDPFERFVQATGATEVLDVCAGAGGPARILVQAIRRADRAPPRFVLTDLHPQPQAWEAARASFPEDIGFQPSSVDATQIPETLSKGRVRVIINAFHHFRPELARRIVADAVAGSRGLFIAESFDRNPLRFLPMLPAGLPALVTTPLLSPRQRLLKLLLVFSAIGPAVSVWDGLVSTLRVYTREELLKMVEPFGDRFTWTYGHYRFGLGGRGYYFHGVPKRETFNVHGPSFSGN